MPMLWSSKDDDRLVDEVRQGKGIRFQLTEETREKIRSYCVANAAVMEKWRDKYADARNNDASLPNVPSQSWILDAMLTAKSNGEVVSTEEMDYAYGCDWHPVSIGRAWQKALLSDSPSRRLRCPGPRKEGFCVATAPCLAVPAGPAAASGHAIDGLVPTVRAQRQQRRSGVGRAELVDTVAWLCGTPQVTGRRARGNACVGKATLPARKVRELSSRLGGKKSKRGEEDSSLLELVETRHAASALVLLLNNVEVSLLSPIELKSSDVEDDVVDKSGLGHDDQQNDGTVKQLKVSVPVPVKASPWSIGAVLGVVKQVE
ncbi:hypothetical protein L7F22_066215 [Adiantum nelumboides]|nr:hypothetical protein [Adiantum nelumboides]